MKRGQMIGQVFIFILAGLVFVLILGYGYKAISNFLARGEEVQLIDFRNELDSAITTIKRDYGSVQRIDLRVPAKTDEVCFVTFDYRDVGAPGWRDAFKQERPLLYSVWDTGSENVFLVPRQPTPMLIKDIVVDPLGKGYLCIPAPGGRISLRVEGTGNKAVIREWPLKEAE